MRLSSEALVSDWTLKLRLSIGVRTPVPRSGYDSLRALSNPISRRGRGLSLNLYLRVEGLARDRALRDADVEVAGASPASERQDASRDLELQAAIGARRRGAARGPSGARASARWPWRGRRRPGPAAESRVERRDRADGRERVAGEALRRARTSDAAAEPDARQRRAGAAAPAPSTILPPAAASHDLAPCRRTAAGLSGTTVTRSVCGNARSKRDARRRAAAPRRVRSSRSTSTTSRLSPSAGASASRTSPATAGGAPSTATSRDGEGGRLARDRVGADRQRARISDAGENRPAEGAIRSSSRRPPARSALRTYRPARRRAAPAPKRDDGRRRARPRARAGP